MFVLISGGLALTAHLTPSDTAAAEEFRAAVQVLVATRRHISKHTRAPAITLSLPDCVTAHAPTSSYAFEGVDPLEPLLLQQLAPGDTFSNVGMVQLVGKKALMLPCLAGTQVGKLETAAFLPLCCLCYVIDVL